MPFGYFSHGMLTDDHLWIETVIVSAYTGIGSFLLSVAKLTFPGHVRTMPFRTWDTI
jgi:hypothetical protein